MKVIIEVSFFLLVIIFIVIGYFWGKKKKLTLFDLSAEKEYIDIEWASKYFYNRLEVDKDHYNIITDKISNDLDFDDVFRKIDRTISKIGQQYFYYKLRFIKSNSNDLSKFTQLVTIFKDNVDIRDNCWKELSKLNSNDNYYFESLFNDDIIYKPKILILCISLNLCMIAILLLSFIFHQIILFIIPIFITNSFLHYRNKSLVNYYLTSIAEFSKALKSAKKICKIEKIKNHFIDFPFLNNLTQIHNKIKFISVEKNLNNDFLALFWVFIELIKITLNVEVIIFYSLIKSIIKYRKEMNELFIFLGEVDVSISVSALYLSGYNLCNPIFENSKNISFKNLYHPLIINCVTNSLELNEKSLLLTGSNMSGKTTFIRSFALNSIFAQTVNISFSSYFKSPYFILSTSIRTQDNINTNTSYYLDEVLTIKGFIDAISEDEPHLFILDEIFKGTNTIERIAIGKSVLSYLNQGRNFVFVSTHDIELADLLGNDNFTLYHFSENISADNLVFDHKIKSGKLQKRNAIKILDLYNYPKSIIIDAIRIVKDSEI
jgi:hypothetical protein